MKRFLEEYFCLFSFVLYVLYMLYELHYSYDNYINPNVLNDETAYLFYFEWIINSCWITLAYFIYCIGHGIIYLFRFKLNYFLSFIHLLIVVFILVIRIGFLPSFYDSYSVLLPKWLAWIFAINLFMSFLMKRPFDKKYDDTGILDVMD